MGCSHLVEDVDLGLRALPSFFDGQSQALDGVVDIDEGPGLFAGPVESDGMVASDLGAEAVEQSPEIAVDVDSVDQVGMQFGLRSTGTPNNSLVELSNFQAEVFLEVEKGDVVEALGHVVDASGVVGMDDLDWLALAFVLVGAVELRHTEAFGNVESFHSPVSVNAHSADVDHVAFGVELHHGNQDVLGAQSVVGVSLVDCLDVLHGVGSRFELGQVHNDIGFEFFKNLKELLFLLGDVNFLEADELPRDLLPLFEPLFNAFDRCDGAVAVFVVDFPPVQVVNNHHFIAEL